MSHASRRRTFLVAGMATASLAVALLACDLSLAPLPTPIPTVTPLPIPASATISGRAWHDLCDLPLSESMSPVPYSPGCIPLIDGTFQANGLEEPGEPGLAGLRVVLAEGGCPGTPLTQPRPPVRTEPSASPRCLSGRYCLTSTPMILSTSPCSRTAVGHSRPRPACGHRRPARSTVAPGDQHRRGRISAGTSTASRQPHRRPPPPPYVATPAGCTDLAGSGARTSASRRFAGDRGRSLSARCGACATPGPARGRPATRWCSRAESAWAGRPSIPLEASVQPGSTVDLGVDLVAPTRAAPTAATGFCATTRACSSACPPPASTRSGWRSSSPRRDRR